MTQFGHIRSFAEMNRGNSGKKFFCHGIIRQKAEKLVCSSANLCTPWGTKYQKRAVDGCFGSGGSKSVCNRLNNIDLLFWLKFDQVNKVQALTGFMCCNATVMHRVIHRFCG
jgi:hypothetical protein